MSKRLRVAVPESLFDPVTMTGRGRMWHEVLKRLSLQCDIVATAIGPSRQPRRRLWRRPDAWLFDGHGGPLQVSEPQVIQLHEAPWSEPETMGTLDPDFLALVVEPSRQAAQFAAAIVCPSASAKDQIVSDSHISADKVFVAHHGVDHTVFRPGMLGGLEVATAQGAEPGRPYVLSLASLHPRKNLLALRESVLHLAAETFPHQLLIVGGPAYGRDDGDELKAALEKDDSGRVVVIPFGLSDTDIAALMCSAAAFCLPSLSEGFGLPALEAMACGTPTVLSNRGSLKEIGHNAAVMVEPTPEGIAGGLRSVLSDPVAASRIGMACAQRAQLFNWDACAVQWMAALRSGVGRP